MSDKDVAMLADAIVCDIEDRIFADSFNMMSSESRTALEERIADRLEQWKGELLDYAKEALIAAVRREVL